MISKTEIYQGMKILADLKLVNRPDLSTSESVTSLVNFWQLYLNKCSYPQYEMAIYLYAKSNRFFPAISDILKYMPVPSKYIQPERVFTYYIATSHDELKADANGKIILEAVAQAGYRRYDLQNVSNRDTLERFIKPKIEKQYKRLIEADQTKVDLLAISNQQMKLEHKEK